MVASLSRRPCHRQLFVQMRPDNPAGYKTTQVPRTPYAIRMWEGSLYAAEWVFEVFDLRSNEPLRSPPGTVEVWHVRGPGCGPDFPDRCEVPAVEDVFKGSLGRFADEDDDRKTYMLHDGDMCVVYFTKEDRSVSFPIPTREDLQIRGKDGHVHEQIHL